uniref:Uncharacterized protein n=1 Tax=Globisporangium ultimum (strain ATCC 200006 / CBS 805.95 / DAOM BR144) TaxID=431595 RepID=K3WVG9_GLOUD
MVTTEMDAAVAPWCGFLRKHADLVLQAARKDDDAFVIRVRLRPQDREHPVLPASTIARCREALELLGAIAHMDNAAWQALLQHQCGCVNLPLVEKGHLPPHFDLRFGDSKCTSLLEFDTQFYRTFFLSGDIEGTSVITAGASGEHPDFNTTVQAIEGRSSKAEYKAAPYPVDLRFIPPRTIEPYDAPRYLHDAVALVKELLAAQGGQQQRTAMLRREFPFALGSIELHVNRLALPAGASLLLAELVTLGVQLYPLISIDPQATIGNLPPCEMAPLLDALMECPLASRAHARERHRVHITKHDESYGFYHSSDGSTEDRRKYANNVRAMCSAIASAKGDVGGELYLDCIVSGASNAQKEMCWRWLAYALLTKHSSAKFSKLSITEPCLRERDVHCMMCVLRSKNPAAKLLNVAEENEQEEDDEDEMDEVHNLNDDQIFGAILMDVIENEEHDNVDTGQEDGFIDSLEERSENGDNGPRCEEREEEVGHEEEEGDTMLEAVRMRSGSTIQISPFSAFEEDDGENADSLVIREDTQFKVLRNDESSEWVDILIPCYGYGRVRRNAVHKFEFNDDKLGRSSSSLSEGYSGAITALCLEFERSVNGNVILPLLQYLGPKLTSLELPPTVGMTSSSVRAVLEACPYLQTFQMHDQLSIAEHELMVAYVSRQCKVADLCITGLVPSVTTLAFLRVLQDPTSAAAQTLQRLQLFPESSEAFDASLLNEMLEVLRVNRVLENLQLYISPALFRDFKPRFAQFHNQSLPVVKAPFPLQSRLALLSVVNASLKSARDNVSGDGPSSRKRARVSVKGIGIRGLGQDVLSLIFWFAAQRSLRQVVVRCR